MAERRSYGLLLFRIDQEGIPSVLLVHPGGPYYVRRDDGCWSIPKGGREEQEEGLAAARREFTEETGHRPPHEPECYLPLGEVKQKGGKIVQAWAFAGEWYADKFASNIIELEWPPRSGRLRVYPEVDRAELFPLSTARRKIKPAQIPFLDRLEHFLAQEYA